MPQAVTHILVPLLLMSIWRDFYLRKKKRTFPLHYVFIAGIAGVLPDIDIVFSVILKLFRPENWWIHKTFTHSLFFPLVLLILGLVISRFHENIRICHTRSHRLKLDIIFYMLALGSFIHIILDMILGEAAFLFYPFSLNDFGLSLISLLPFDADLIIPLLDGVLLVIWLVYLELKHKISDFI